MGRRCDGCCIESTFKAEATIIRNSIGTRGTDRVSGIYIYEVVVEVMVMVRRIQIMRVVEDRLPRHRRHLLRRRRARVRVRVRRAAQLMPHGQTNNQLPMNNERYPQTLTLPNLMQRFRELIRRLLESSSGLIIIRRRIGYRF